MLELGSTVAGYRIERLVGRGGMGVVYLATQLTLERPVAIKVIAPELTADQGFRKRFEHESRIAASIDHANVLPVYEAGEQDGLLYIVMRFVEGMDLQQALAREGRFEPLRAARILAQVGAGLDAAHGRGLVHRDVKPANVLIVGPEGREHVYLTDFGLTKRSASTGSLTKTGQWVGTLDYVAPEQLRGDPVDARADVYALGCMLYRTLTGEVPYPRDSDVAKLWAHMNIPPPVLSDTAPEVGKGFDHVVLRAMAKSSEQRFPSAGELGEAALAVAEGRGGDHAAHEVGPPRPALPPVPSPPPARPRPGRRRGMGLPLLLATAGLLVLVLATVQLVRSLGDDPERTSFEVVGDDRLALRSALARGVEVELGCDAACRFDVRLSVGARRARALGLGSGGQPVTVGTRTGRLGQGGTRTLAVQFDPRAKRRLKRAQALELGVSSTVVSGEEEETRTRAVRLSPRRDG